MKLSCIIADKMHPSLVPSLESMGWRVDYRPEITREDLLKEIEGYQGLVIRSKTKVDADFIQAAGSLKFVARAGAGVDNLDSQSLANSGIHVIIAPEGNRLTLGEHALAMLLNLLHNVTLADRSVREGLWQREVFRGTELSGKTIGLIGYGNMGSAFAKMLPPFKCRVLAYDKFLKDFSDEYVQEAGLEELYPCDILSLHVPLTMETKGFYDYSFFSRFYKPLILLNTARGEILPLSDLVKLMRDQKITAAALDVFEIEPISQLSDKQRDVYEYLINSDRILLTPHIAGWSYQSYERINAVILEKLAQLQSQGLFD
ncbi:MAG: phosphoglycerate dehydrogenase [Cyclobacteriaceae bacterium]|nr:phosphoglycerate dehydrogenase [Cyclobacteriaceae bacterium]